MPRTITTTVYQFDELNDKAKERVRQWYREGALDYEWWKCLHDEAATVAELMGLDIRQRKQTTKTGEQIYLPSIYFSGFCSQGDGACFDGAWQASQVQPDKLKQATAHDADLADIAYRIIEISRQFPQASFRVKQSGHYSNRFATMFDIELGEDTGEPITVQRYDALEQVENRLMDAARDYMDWIYRALEKEHDWLLADAQINNAIRANEYEFYADGRHI